MVAPTTLSQKEFSMTRENEKEMSLIAAQSHITHNSL